MSTTITSPRRMVGNELRNVKGYSTGLPNASFSLIIWKPKRQDKEQAQVWNPGFWQHQVWLPLGEAEWRYHVGRCHCQGTARGRWVWGLCRASKVSFSTSWIQANPIFYYVWCEIQPQEEGKGCSGCLHDRPTEWLMLFWCDALRFSMISCLLGGVKLHAGLHN